MDYWNPKFHWIWRLFSSRNRSKTRVMGVMRICTEKNSPTLTQNSQAQETAREMGFVAFERWYVQDIIGTRAIVLACFIQPGHLLKEVMGITLRALQILDTVFETLFHSLFKWTRLPLYVFYEVQTCFNSCAKFEHSPTNRFYTVIFQSLPSEKFYFQEKFDFCK